MKNSKKGFTLVELIIVVAVIALLAAVLIPTFSSLISKANQAKDEALVSNLNKAVALSTEKYDTVYDVLGAVKENAGFDVAKISASVSEHEILWDSVNYCFVYKTTGGVKYIPETQSTTIADNEQYKFWQICDEKHPIPETQTYSIYWAGADLPEVNVAVGFDAGDASVGTINYVNNSNNEQKVVLNAKGTQTINVDAEKDTIKQFGEVQDVNIAKCAPDSYEIYGKVSGTVTVKQGHVKVEEKATVGTVIVPADATGAVKLTNNGTLSVVNTISAPTSANISVSNNGAIDVSVGTTQIEGTQSTTKYETVKKLTSDTHEITEGGFYDGTGVTIGSTIDFGVGNYAIYINTAEKVVISGLKIEVDAYGILVSKQGEAKRDFTLMNSEIKGSRALCAKGADGVIVNNCTFSCKGIADYNKQVENKTVGILLNNSGANLTVSNSIVQGFAYSIYTSDAGDITINMTDSVFKGRAGLALIDTNNLVANVSGCKIHGINGFKGNTEEYGNLTTQSPQNNNITNIVFNVSDCEFSVYRLPATTNNHQYAIYVDFANTKVNLSGNNTFVADIRYAENLTAEELKAKAYDITCDTCDEKTRGNNGFTSVVMTISSANENSVVVKVK